MAGVTQVANLIILKVAAPVTAILHQSFMGGASNYRQVLDPGHTILNN